MPFLVTCHFNPNHVQVRGNSTIWLKENLWNLGVQRSHSKKILFLDADVKFERPDWYQAISDELERHAVVHPWSDAVFLGPQFEFVGHSRSFMSQYCQGDKWPGHPPVYGQLWHPGFAVAWRRDALDAVGGVYEKAIVGNGDSIMMQALVGLADDNISKHVSEGMIPSIMTYQERCLKHIRKDVGYINGIIIHHWHGRHVNRKYEERKAILIDNQFNPEKHLIRNSYGVLELHEDCLEIRDAIHRWHLDRNDDANTVN
jgi:hypothetical protein